MITQLFILFAELCRINIIKLIMKRFFMIAILWNITLLVAGQTKDSTTVSMDSILHELPEVMVKGERPIVKAVQGKLVYDLSRLVSNLPVDNAFDAIKELPGVTDQQGTLTLAGSGVNVVINGKVSTMSIEQLYSLLKTIPVSRIESAEVMYAAPARYNVRGPMINLVLKSTQSESASLMGELYSAWEQKYYENFTERGSLLFSSKNLSADLLYSYNKGREYSERDTQERHLLNGTLYDLNQYALGHSRDEGNDVRLGVDYHLSKEDVISMVYNTQLSNAKYTNRTTGSENTNVDKQDDSQLHNLKIDYQSSFGMKAGTDFTYYEAPSSQLFHGEMNNTTNHFLSKDQQRINKWVFYLNETHKLPHNWGINYGMQYTTSTDHSFQKYYDDATGEYLPDNSMISRHREHTFNGFAGFDKSFGDKLSMDASLAAEHYKTDVWNEWTFYPTLNVTYTPKAGHVFQLAFSSDKQYPSYWSTNNTTSYSSSYIEIQGNPLLKPSREYQSSLTYILKSKYLLTAFFDYVPDYFTQVPYQSPERLVLIYKFHNFNYQRQAGLQTVIPFKVKDRLNSSITLVGYYKREKDSNFYDIPFDRDAYSFIASMDNTLILSTQPDLKFTLTGFYQNGTIQGIYDLSRSYNINTALKWTFDKQRAQLTLKGDDLFNTDNIKTTVDYVSQNSRMTILTNNRAFTLSFTYKFGNYKEKERKGVDTSRFSK